jgi:addiction module RelE/StbE family toxin
MWNVSFSRKAKKQVKKLEVINEDVVLSLQLLVSELIEKGPEPSAQWKNYGPIKGQKKSIDKRHCHLMKGKPTYVCCWEVIDNEIQIIEVYYVGTHENAPY